MDLSSQPVETPEPRQTVHPASGRNILFGLLALLIVLLVAGYFRTVGLMWGDYSYPHPDERFLVWVTADIAPVHNLAEYFNTATSTLNPGNRGHQFYVYGDFPVILTRYLTESLFKQVGWQEVIQTGRGLSALFDLLTVLLVYLITQRISGWKVAAVAGLLSAAAVLQIQQAHFYTTDSFSTFFSTLALYLAVLIATDPNHAPPPRILALNVFFGLTVGLAMACKINTAVVAVLLPVALLIRWLRDEQAGEKKMRLAVILAIFAVVSGAVAFLTFRLAQPYAFKGPGFANISIDANWLKSIRDLQAQSAGDVDFPPALQWARRTHLFSLENMVVWGLGIPLGVMGWVGFLLFAWRAFGRIRGWMHQPAAPLQMPEPGARIYTPAHNDLWHALSALLVGAWPGVMILWLWNGAYFLWQSMAWNATMRYQLPIYPTMAILAAWGLGDLWRRPWRGVGRFTPIRWPRPWRVGVAAAGVLIVGLTLAYAFAFTRIYTRPETRVAASRWIYDNVPGPVNLQGTSAAQPWTQLLGVRPVGIIRPGLPYLTWFNSDQSGAVTVLHLPQTQVVQTGSGAGGLMLRVRVYDPASPDQALASGEVTLPFGSLDQLDIPIAGLPQLQSGKRYRLALEITDSQGKPLTEVVPVTVNISGAVTFGMYTRAQTTTYQSAGGPATMMLPDGGTLRQVRLPVGALLNSAVITVVDSQTGEQVGSGAALLPYSPAPVLNVDSPIVFKPGVSYLVSITSNVPGEVLAPSQPAQLDFLDEPGIQSLPDLVPLPRTADPMWFTFTPTAPASLSKVSLGHVEQVDPTVKGATALQVQLFTGGDPSKPIAQASLNTELNAVSDPRGGEVALTFNPPVQLSPNQSYSLSVTPNQGAIAVRGSRIGNESTWDMGLPFRLDNYDPFGGIYSGDLFEMYWDDNADKYQRFVNILDQSDYLAFSSNRQWGTTTRVPERYPLTTEFYRRLLGCPVDKDVVWCYRVAEPGMFHGDLGYDLVKTFTSYPNLGPLQINDQFAEEAFTVYDHAKVMIFHKRADYSAAQVRTVLGAVDLTKVVHLTPRKASSYKDLLLPARLWAIQQGGGTWAKLFPPGGLLNRYPGLSLLAWYGFLLLLGVLIYPIVRLALPGLPDRGYPLGRIIGLVLLAYLAWLAGSLTIPVTRLLLLAIFVLIAVAGLALAYLRRGELREEWRLHKKYFLAVELVALVLFAIDLGIRWGNPDLWHPIFGGEKPMDFSYFNAVLKSTVFPPYDPWFAGGYINYYYYGFALVGMPVKLLGINPSVAYNLILPALFMTVGLGAFSVGTNLFAARWNTPREEVIPLTGDPAAGDTPAAENILTAENAPLAETTPAAASEPPVQPRVQPRRNLPLVPGILAVFALLLLGNLGTVRMIWQGWQKMVVPDETMAKGNMVQHVNWAAQGFAKWLQDPSQPWPYYPGDWYWKPSRAIEPETGNEITEFPLFTFLYADLHAHLMALPVTILVVAWALGMILGMGSWGIRGSTGARSPSGGRFRWLSFGLAILIGALAAGLLRPANTWDQYTYLTLAAVALAYGQWRTTPRSPLKIILPVVLLVGLAVLLYRPFDTWFEQGYNSLELWKGPKTNLNSYLTHWGLFLFVIVAWLFEETVDWMARTPLSALGRLRAYGEAVYGVAAALVVLMLILLWQGVWIALIAVPVGVWVAVLLFRPGQPDVKRAVLFMIGTAMALTLAVELVAVKGDIGRMNTVFKFYYQAWTLLALSAAAGLAWLWPRLPGWRPGWRSTWQVGLGVLVVGAALFSVTAARAKIDDRMTPTAPHTLDGMLYMNYTSYTDGLTEETLHSMDLSQDYRAIQWMRANVPGSPVIVEANTPEYRHWGTRYTIYTGLPGVIGWNWHQRQQRTITPDTWVYDRINEIQAFYQTTDRTQAQDFLRRYNVKYIIVGQLERIWYRGAGLTKFTQLNGVLWDQVYAEGDTVIYKVR